jgi:S1-C subfamily serine protease
MPINYKFSIRVATIALALTALMAGAFAQSPEKSKKPKQSGWIGVMIVSVTEESNDENAPKSDEGALIESVVKKSPADSAGLKQEDVVIAFGGTPIKEADELSKVVSSTSPGTKTTITVVRKGEKKTLDIVVGKSKGAEMKILTPGYDLGVAGASPFGERRMKVFVQHGTLGMEVRELSEQLAEYFGAPEGEGVLVENVEKESAAAKAGFKAGDVILRAGKKMVDEVEDIRKVLRKQEEGDKLDFEVLRKGTKKTLTVTIEEGMVEHPQDAFEVAPGNENSFQFWHESPGPDMKRFNIELDRMHKNLNEQEKDLQKIIRKRIRISTDDEV